MRRMMVLLVLCTMTLAVSASRAKIEFKDYVQPDGTIFTLTLWGNAHFHCYRDLAGHVFSRDSLGFFHPITIPVTDDVPEVFPTRSISGISDIGYCDAGWNAMRVYRQLVVLVEFADCSFSCEDPRGTYDAMFNEPGYNQRLGAGCVADYFRDQSQGLLNLQFDVYGPFKVSSSVRSSAKKDHGPSIFQEAMRLMMAENPDVDFSPYDWNGNKRVNQVVFVYAGYAGNQTAVADEGYLWPNTWTFGSVTTPDGYRVSAYSASGELWTNDTSCGIGTICHELSHALSPTGSASMALPDIYPTGSSDDLPFSVVDEWDLMDGGPSTNRGWCPPNYSPLEKMIMGWLEPEELTGDTVISNLKPLAEGGMVFLIRHTDSEFLLLENRQWSGWDLGLPGRGLLIYHVKFDRGRWVGNIVNNVSGKPYYSIVAADNMDFDDWRTLHVARHGRKSQYYNNGWMNSTLMSTAAYPWQTDSTSFVNRTLNATSAPSTQMYDTDANGSRFLSKSITDITQHADGTVSFTLRNGQADGIRTARRTGAAKGVYSLSGSSLDAPLEQLPKGIYIVDGKKIVRR